MHFLKVLKYCTYSLILLLLRFSSMSIYVAESATGTVMKLCDKFSAIRFGDVLVGKTVKLFRDRLIACTSCSASKMFCASSLVRLCLMNLA